MKIKGSSFTTASLVLLMLTLFAYFLIIDYWLAALHPEIPTSYKELLLRKTQGPRIIVDSGSNSYYAIDPLILERSFKMPAINLADNIGYPLSHKFYYLAQYAKPDDIIILPLEWANYDHKPFFDDYILPVLDGSLTYYYQPLPYIERLNFVFKHVPINTFFSAVSKRVTQAIDPNYHRKNLARYKKRLLLKHGNSLGAGLNPDTITPTESFTLDYICDEAVLPGLFKISDQFRDEMEIIKSASKKGVQIIFTWPAVVDKEGNGCYKSKRVSARIDQYVQQLRATLQENGFIVVGDPWDSVFSSDSMHDAFYHITESASKIRTERLAQRLIEVGISPANTKYKPGDSIRGLESEIDRLLDIIDNNRN